ncbi:MAG: DUF2971 domain-containing protein [Chloroflexota bacterium]
MSLLEVLLVNGERLYYHFTSTEHAIDDLENRWLKVGRIDDLNDPHELMPYRRYERPDRRLYDPVFKAVCKKWGVLCFSETWQRMLLWAHYAEGHRGVALGFAIPEGSLIKVNYRCGNLRPKVELTDSDSENEQRLLDMAGVKFKEWEYEQEHRWVMELEDCKFKVVEDRRDGRRKRLYFKRFADDSGDDWQLREVVLGCQFHKSHGRSVRMRVVELAEQRGARLWAVRAGWEHYGLNRDGRTYDQIVAELAKPR